MRCFYLTQFIYCIFIHFTYCDIINNPYNIIIYRSSYNNHNNKNPYSIILNTPGNFLPNKKIYEKYKIDMVKRHTKSNTKKLKKLKKENQ